MLYYSGGGERDRTDDLLRARQALSQLSYTPTESRIANFSYSQSEIQNPNSVWWA